MLKSGPYLKNNNPVVEGSVPHRWWGFLLVTKLGILYLLFSCFLSLNSFISQCITKSEINPKKRPIFYKLSNCPSIMSFESTCCFWYRISVNALQILSRGLLTGFAIVLQVTEGFFECNFNECSWAQNSSSFVINVGTFNHWKVTSFS